MICKSSKSQYELCHGTNSICIVRFDGICKWYDRSKQFHKPVCRLYEITNVDKKSQGLRGAIEWYKQNIWIEQNMGNGI